MKKSTLDNLFNIINHYVIILQSCQMHQIRLFAGTYTEGTQKGFFIFDLDREAGTFKLVSGNDAGPNPSYFCISKKKGIIYAANEVEEFNGVKGGGVTALSYDAKTGVAEKIGELAVPNGGPAYIAISPG